MLPQKIGKMEEVLSLEGWGVSCAFLLLRKIFCPCDKTVGKETLIRFNQLSSIPELTSSQQNDDIIESLLDVVSVAISGVQMKPLDAQVLKSCI